MLDTNPMKASSKVKSRYSSRIVGSAIALLALLTLYSCFAGRSEPMPPRVDSAAFPLPPVGDTIPIYIYINQPSGLALSIQRKNVMGVAKDGSQLHALSLEEAAHAAGGADKLLARLSDEGAIEHVAKAAGMATAVLPLAGAAEGCAAGLGAGDPLLAMAGCAVGRALGAALGLGAAIGVTAKLGFNEEARQLSMLEKVSLPDDVKRNPISGYVYLPAADFKMLRVPVIDPRDELPFNVRIPIVGR